MFCQLPSHKRTNESPMDFEWQTHAPTDPKSPFPLSKPGHKGFESKGVLFSSINQSPTIVSKYRNPSFTTPQKELEHEIFSETSGIESSPGEQGDLEETPDHSKSPQIAPVIINSGTIRQPIFGKYGTDFLGSSPSRTDHRRGKYGKTIVQKMRKRKRIERDFALCQNSESDSDSNIKSKNSKTKNPKVRVETSQPTFLASFFNYIESHPNLPNVLSFYAQLTVNLFIAGLMIFGIFTFWTTVRADVDRASEQERSVALAQIAKCAHDFVLNGCASNSRPPVMEIPCNEFDLCMNRDPDSVGRARISAHTFAQIFNSFIEPISYKAMIFIVLIIIVTIVVNNVAFGLYRSKSHSQHSPFPHLNSQGFQPWFTQMSSQNLGHNVFVDQNYQKTGTNRIDWNIDDK